jgi:signal peptidase II
MKLKLPQLLGFGIIVDIIILDQLSKWWITEYILRPTTGGDPVTLGQWIIDAPERVGRASVDVISNFNLTMVWNEGVSFGMLQNAGIWPLVGLAFLISAILAYMIVKTNSKFEALSLGIIIGGAMGNVIDRFRFGGVADFFDVYVGTYHWPAFNIADACISIGVVLLLIHGLFMNKEDKKA